MGLKILNHSLYMSSPYKNSDVFFWNRYMGMAIKEAEKALKDGEVPVGAVVIDDKGEVLSKAHNCCISLCDPTAHAEILVLRRACESVNNYRLTGSVLITTLEPCIMCLGAMIHARIDGLVFGTLDPKSGVVVSNMDFNDLTWVNHRFWVIYGVLSHRSSEILRKFFKSKR